jgi:hypothetical protein
MVTFQGCNPEVRFEVTMTLDRAIEHRSAQHDGVLEGCMYYILYYIGPPGSAQSVTEGADDVRVLAGAIPSVRRQAVQLAGRASGVGVKAIEWEGNRVGPVKLERVVGLVVDVNSGDVEARLVEAHAHAARAAAQIKESGAA